MSKRYFEGTEHAALYAQFRPRSPQQVVDRIINYLKEKVIFNIFKFKFIFVFTIRILVRWRVELGFRRGMR